MTDDNDYVIWSYEHTAWWGPARWGYTEQLDKAGHYTKREAEQIVANANIVKVNEVALTFREAQEKETHARSDGPSTD